MTLASESITGLPYGHASSARRHARALSNFRPARWGGHGRCVPGRDTRRHPQPNNVLK